jgi:hypothetical protein
MDLRQNKLTKGEWEALEIPVSAEELKILKLIQDGYENLNIRFNEMSSLINFMKITSKVDIFHEYLYTRYCKKLFDKIIKKYKCDKIKMKFSGKIKLKKADIIRIDNSDQRLEGTQIYEFLLLKLLSSFLRSKKKGGEKMNYYYYTLIHLMKNSVSNLNIYVMKHIRFILENFKKKINIKHFIKNAYKYIEQNNYITQYSDIRLYDHQKKLFSMCKRAGPKLILYQAPTGTGKTISPVGLANHHKLIFVCAAKHIGLQFAKSCISLKLPIAVAFGCKDPGDVKLHYYSVIDFVKNRRTGGIFRVDNTVGDKVKIMISDIQSYLPAMRYMTAFNKREDIIWYWDEPTITLDYETHEFHKIMSENWKQNEIPNIVLSSATLPSEKRIISCIQAFKTKFIGGKVRSIVSHDCKKTIPIIDKNCNVVLPHYIFEKSTELKHSVDHIENYKTLLRHFDLREVIDFIMYINENNLIKQRYDIETHFENVESIDSIGLKEYYLTLLKYLSEDKYSTIYNYFQKNRSKRYNSVIYATTKDAKTLTDGPAIFLTDNPAKVANFCLKSADIPTSVLENMLQDMRGNDKVQCQLDRLKRELNNLDGGNKEKDKSDKRKSEKEPQNIKKKEIESNMKGLYSKLKCIQLNQEYIPNSISHKRKWKAEDIKNTFMCDLDQDIIEKILFLRIENTWKLLLMMGIGVFQNHECVQYSELMKKLASDQKLYLIIASSDYIYGTNYQFCHGYISKDLENMSQEKTIQAFGRIGRSNAQHDYSIRLRSDLFIRKLFKEENGSIEVNNMNRLFGI